MGASQIPLDTAAAEAHLLNFLQIPGQSGEEAEIAAAVSDALIKVGVAANAIRFDTANQRINLPTQTGNLFADIPGTRPGPRLVFATHLDVVPICDGAKPIIDGDHIKTDGSTGLGGDNRTGCAVLVSLAETLLKHKLPHPPITLLFTVREESGIQGAQHLDAAQLQGAVMGFNVDSRVPADLITGAVGQESWEVEIFGQAAHAGVAPERGISATMVGALALAEVRQGGWFGKVQQPDDHGTSNVGIFGGKGKQPAGNATNVVTDYVFIKGESRSPRAEFATAITAAYKTALENAARQVTDADGKPATLNFSSHAAYPPFNLPDDSPAVARAKRAAESLGMKPTTVFSNGGLDANWFVKHGLPTVTIGAGQYEIHTVNEYVNLPEFFDGCRLAVALATIAD
ncbi:MAG: M20/M25/M40 family metallo-hydrolase [Pirellulales bacterium]|nr:M20/M25/M40 family metallo-hydrolase [Pirellulales bacterium]